MSLKLLKNTRTFSLGKILLVLNFKKSLVELMSPAILFKLYHTVVMGFEP